MRYAGFWIRFWAAMVDILVLTPIWVTQAVIEAVGKLNSGVIVVFFLILVVVGQWLYFACFESGGWQATPGKRLMGLRVTDLEGCRISFSRATGRYFSKILSTLIFFIGYIMVGLTDKKQGLHDNMAETLVLRGKAGGAGAADAGGSTVVVPTTNASRWVMAGFDEKGHLVRLKFSDANPKLEQGGLIIGREAKSCDLHMNDQSVSRQHARIFSKEGAIWIEDLGSTNGIEVNGRSIRKGCPVVLPTEGNITVGDVELSIGKN